MTRGIRNNNPLNIKEWKENDDTWVGERATDDDPIFEEFETMEHGIRAGYIILRKYFRVYGLNTVKGIIKRWSATDQISYVNTVCMILNALPDEPLRWSKQRAKGLVSAMSYVENGGNYITEAQLEKAWGLL